jgi:hypothetical protein
VLLTQTQAGMDLEEYKIGKRGMLAALIHDMDSENPRSAFSTVVNKTVYADPMVTETATDVALRIVAKSPQTLAIVFGLVVCSDGTCIEHTWVTCKQSRSAFEVYNASYQPCRYYGWMVTLTHYIKLISAHRCIKWIWDYAAEIPSQTFGLFKETTSKVRCIPAAFPQLDVK